jgi:integrase/ribosomal protein L40E
MDKVYLHQENQTLNTLLARIKGEHIERKRHDSEPMFEEPVPEPNCSKLLMFHRSLVTEELSLGRICVLLGNMYRISIWLNHRSFEQLTRDDIIDLIEKIKAIRTKKRGKESKMEGYAVQTIESYKITIKKFWRWLRNPGLMPKELKETAYPPEVNWIKRRKSKNGLLPKDVWTPEEINKVAALVGNTRDKAFILGLFGSGCRIGEFLLLKREDIVFDEYTAQILVDGKTGSRRVRLTPAATLAMSAWLDVHPNKSPEVPVWVNIQVRKEIPNQHLSYAWAYKLLRDLAKRAEINKPIRPHLLRHSLATYYAPKLTEAVMNEHFGWQQGGRTASIYTHLSGKQVDDQILSVFGRKKVDLRSNKAVDIVLCQRCGLENTPSSMQCRKCGFPLTEKAAMKLHERRKKADELMNRLMENPKFLSVLERFLNNAGIERS